ncbi:ABC transporter permease [Saccharopolyspora aridisoli]|uniref:ABC transporter permease n=1 Tax=Saccharopolyspora aridisoli TaxID=2530385 RepID=UPI001F2F0C41|nr:ABC transporter permease [Saccharopolyspora aridisoli]
MTIPLGVVVALNVGSLASQIGAEGYGGAVVAFVVVGQAAPLVCALIVACSKGMPEPGHLARNGPHRGHGRSRPEPGGHRTLRRSGDHQQERPGTPHRPEPHADDTHPRERPLAHRRNRTPLTHVRPAQHPRSPETPAEGHHRSGLLAWRGLRGCDVAVAESATLLSRCQQPWLPRRRLARDSFFTNMFRTVDRRPTRSYFRSTGCDGRYLRCGASTA